MNKNLLRENLRASKEQLRLYRTLSNKDLRRISDGFQERWRAHKVRSTPNVALTPLLLSRELYTSLAPKLLLIKRALEKMIESFRCEAKHHRKTAPLHQAFLSYQPWWEIIARERRQARDINYLRFDTVLANLSQLKMLETNTACPATTFFNPYLQGAYEAVDQLAPIYREHQKVLKDLRSHCFMHFLFAYAQKLTGRADPNVAVGSFGKFYNMEIGWLKTDYARARDEGRVPPKGEFVVGDVRDLSVEKGRAILSGRPIDLLYLKLNPLELQRDDPGLKRFFQAVEGGKIELLNSFGALYLAETKRSLALLRTPTIQDNLHLDARTRLAIAEVIPQTEILDEELVKVHSALGSSVKQWILKPDALTRGKGISFGADFEAGPWGRLLEKRLHGPNPYVLQELLPLPRVKIKRLNSDGQFIEEEVFWQLDWYFFGDRAAVLGSRCRNHRIVNIDSGGNWLNPFLV